MAPSWAVEPGTPDVAATGAVDRPLERRTLMPLKRYSRFIKIVYKRLQTKPIPVLVDRPL